MNRMRTILALIFSLLATAASAQPGPGPTQPWVQNGPLIYYPNGSVNAGTSSLNNTGAGTFNASDGYYLNNSLVQSVTATDAPLNYSAGTLSLNINSSLTVDGSNNLGINLSHANSWLAPQTFSDGATFSAAITYGGVTLSNSVTGTGAMVLSSGSTIANPTFTGSVSAAGLITNTDLAFDYVYVNGVPCTLGVASPGCSITATAANVTVGGGSPTGVINGTPGDILAVGSGPSLTQIAVTGSGSVVLATAPTIAGETVSGTANFTGTFEIGGQAETFPASGLLVGTTDTQSLTNKSIAGSEINSGTVGAAYLPIATSAAQGIVQGDGSTLTISTGVISCTTMTASQIGCGYPDNSTIVVVSGKLTVIGAAASSITIGVTSIGGGTSGDLLSNNSGTLSQVSLGTGFSVSGGAINTPWSYSGVNITSNNSGYVGIGSGEFLIADTVSLPTSPNSGTYLNIDSINGIGYAQEYNYSTSTYGTFDIANLNLAVGTLSIGGKSQYDTPQVHDPGCGTSGHDCSTAWQDCVNTAAAGGRCHVPAGTYSIGTCATITGAVTGGMIDGGGYSTNMQATGATNCILSIGDGTNTITNFQLNNMRFTHSGTPTGGNMLTAQGVSPFTSSNIWMDSNIWSGAQFSGNSSAGLGEISLRNWHVNNCLGNGIVVYSSAPNAEFYIDPASIILGCAYSGIIIGGGMGGVRIAAGSILNAYGITIETSLGGIANREIFMNTNSDVDSNTSGGVVVGTNSMALLECVGCWSAGNTGNGFSIPTQSGSAGAGGSYSKFVGAHVASNSSTGISLTDSGGNYVISGSTIVANAYGIGTSGLGSIAINGNLITSNTNNDSIGAVISRCNGNIGSNASSNTAC